MSERVDLDFLVFLDRDGTIIEDRNYLSHPDGVMLLPGAAEGLRRMRALGGRLVLVTNQSGISRGYFDRPMADAINDRLREVLVLEDVLLAGIHLCPHHPDEGCECRKPGTRLFEKAACEQGLDLSDSYMIGDQPSDMEAGRRIGARSVLVIDEKNGSDPTGAERLVVDLVEAAAFIEESRPPTLKAKRGSDE